MNWDNYDNWRLSSLYDNEHDIEVFETERYGYVSNDENQVNEFDDKIRLAEKNDCMYLHICDSLEEYAEELADELGLHTDEYSLISTLEEDYRDDKIEAAERKADEERDERRMK